MTIADAIKRLVDRENLTEDQSANVAREIMRGDATPAQIAALLVALRMKGETVDEITGFVREMRAEATSVPIDDPTLVDTCGTGGDGSGTFNISTVAAFVAAGAGCKVAKHGNRSISSQCGSADVLKALGVNIEMTPEESAKCIRDVGVGFLFAPQYHPGARHAAGPRREIGVRSIFNMIGPLLNPAGAKRQVMGVYDRNLTEPIAQVLRRLGSTHCLVVCGEDGLDEITIAGLTHLTELKGGQIQSRTISPEDMGIQRTGLESIRGGDAETNAEIAKAILAGALGPKRDVVLLNAAAAIYVSGIADSLADGVQRAAESIDTGKARRSLDALA